MRILDIRERTVPISRYADPELPSGGLTTSTVAVVTDVIRGGEPVVGYGFSSFGRYGQGGLIRERFAPRILSATADALTMEDGSNVDPLRVWSAMMAGEKPGGHGERCVAVGTLDMAVWDAAAKIAGQPLYRFAAGHLGRPSPECSQVSVYASGGYHYPADDLSRLREEVAQLVALGYTHLKIKIGSAPIETDARRIETVLDLSPSGDHLAVDAMNRYTPQQSLEAAAAFEPYGLWWFEDICDPLDFETLAEVAGQYRHPIAAGEALFSREEAKLLHLYGGLRPKRDVLLFDPVHSYGLTHYAEIVGTLAAEGWPRIAFWPHGGHLFSLHVAAALGLGGSEVNPFSFAPLGGLSDDAEVTDGAVGLPDAPGIGLETQDAVAALLRTSLG